MNDIKDLLKIGAIIVAICLVLVGINHCQDAAENEKETVTIEQQVAQDGYTVYVSRSGKIHNNSSCSGMKYYKKMGYNDARKAGYDLCQNCY